MKTLYLIRHGKASLDGSESSRVLTPEGFTQAEQLSTILEELEPAIKYLFSSPFIRAQQTLEPIAEKLNLQARVIEDLRERQMAAGPVENLMEERKRMWEDLSYKLEGGESGEEAQGRAQAAIEEILSTVEEGQAAAVASHGNLIGLILRGIDPAFGFDEWRSMTMPDIFRIEIEGDNLKLEHVGCEGVDTFKIGS